MAMISPTERKFERDPEEGNFPTGLYLVRLDRVQEVGPSAKFPNGNPRLVFEFTVTDPQHPDYAGKKTCLFVGKSLFKDPKTGKESNLVKFARSMGVIKPEEGFDPEMLIGKHFNAMCENQDDRAWVRTLIAAGAPSAGPTTTAGSGPPPRKGSPAAEKSYWFVPADGVDAQYLTVTQIKDKVEKEGLRDITKAEVCENGSEDWKPLTVAIPESCNWIPF